MCERGSFQLPYMKKILFCFLSLSHFLLEGYQIDPENSRSSQIIPILTEASMTLLIVFFFPDPISQLRDTGNHELLTDIPALTEAI